MRVFFLHINAALEVKNRVQFAWAKSCPGVILESVTGYGLGEKRMTPVLAVGLV